MIDKVFRKPPEMAWFVGVLILSVIEIFDGGYLGLLTAVPFLLASILVSKHLQLFLWVIFSAGAWFNFYLSVTGEISYVSAVIYFLLSIYGPSVVYKLLKTQKK